MAERDMACRGQTKRLESARVRVAVARRIEEVGHMRDCPDRMGELERRLRRDGIELARSKGGASSIAPAEGGQDDSVQRNHLACMGRAGWPGNASPGRCAPVEPTPRRRDRWGASHDGARRPGARGPARRLRRSDGDYWKPSSEAVRRTGPV